MLDLTQFDTDLWVPCWQVPLNQLNKVLKAPTLKSLIYRRTGVPHVRPGPDSFKVVLVDPDLWAALLADQEKADQLLKDLADLSVEVRESQEKVRLSFACYSYEEVLEQVLPADVQTPRAFETVGQLAHFNLTDDQLPFGDLIGQVFLLKYPHFHTVVTKVGQLDNEFRTPNLRVLAGTGETQSEVWENKCRFQFDYAQVYWNSRLSQERERIVEKLRPSPAFEVWDVFAGCGALCVFLAQLDNCQRVFANDLNPQSVEACRLNFQLNKIDPEKVEVSNADGREFLRTMAKKAVASAQGPIEILMNLPQLALDFLDVFRESCLRSVNYRIHCYCFSKTGDLAPILKDLEYLGPLKVESFREVRNVAPNKSMFCLTFRFSNKRPAPAELDSPLD